MYYGFRLQRSVEIVERVDEAAAALLGSLAQYDDAREVLKRWGQFGAFTGESLPAPPSRNSVSISLNVLVMATRGDDRKVARQLLAAWTNIATGTGDTSGDIGVLAGAVTAWRTGEKTGDVLTSHIRDAESLASDQMTIEDAEQD